MSRERRFFTPDLTLHRDELVLATEEAHHLLHVLRLSEGDEVVAFDGEGRAARAVVASADRGKVTLRRTAEEPSRESPLSLTMAIAVPKGDRMAVAVQKLTELGVHRIVPLETERGEVPGSRMERSLSRWRRVALEACKQSGRSYLPRIEPPCSMANILEEPFERRLMSQPGAPRIQPKPRRGANVLALVGPEGGWSPAELSLAAEHSVTPFGLGPRTLRTETAAIAAATLLQFLAGDVGSDE